MVFYLIVFITLTYLFLEVRVFPWSLSSTMPDIQEISVPVGRWALSEMSDEELEAAFQSSLYINTLIFSESLCAT
jgi:hypothetical protein